MMEMNKTDYKKHRKKHTRKENTHDWTCPYCNGLYPDYIPKWEK